MSNNTPVLFIGIPISKPELASEFIAYVLDSMKNITIEPITFFENKNITQWNFVNAYFLYVNSNSHEFNLIVSKFGGNDGGNLDDILLGYNTKQHYLDLFETLLEYAK